MKRAADRERAGIRRTRQHGETEDQYIERIRAQLETETGLDVHIERRHHPSDYLIRGYVWRGSACERAVPDIRIHRVALLSAIDAFKAAAHKLRHDGMLQKAGGAS